MNTNISPHIIILICILSVFLGVFFYYIFIDSPTITYNIILPEKIKFNMQTQIPFAKVEIDFSNTQKKSASTKNLVLCISKSDEIIHYSKMSEELNIEKFNRNNISYIYTSKIYNIKNHNLLHTNDTLLIQIKEISNQENYSQSKILFICKNLKEPALDSKIYIHN